MRLLLGAFVCLNLLGPLALAGGGLSGARGAEGVQLAQKPAADQLRTWADKSGKFSVRAKFVELTNGELTLETPDGKQVTIPLDKLGEADRKLAEKLAKDADSNPFKSRDKAPGNPFQPKSAGGDASTAASGAGRVISDVDWSQVREIVVEPPATWSLTPDAAPAPPGPLTTRPIMLQSKPAARGKPGDTISVFENSDDLIFYGSQGQALISLIDKPLRTPTVVSVFKVDLVQGRVQETATVPATVRPVDVDPTGRYLLARTDFNLEPNGPRTEISVWEFAGKSLRHVRTWNAVRPEDMHGQSPSVARFVDSGHVVTATLPHSLVLWETATSRPVYRLTLAPTTRFPALSAGGKYLAAAVNGGVFIFDALSGKTLARPAGDPGMVTSLSFDPGGRRLAALSSNRLIVWDLDRGEIYRDIYFSRALQGETIDWVSDGCVLLDGAKLIDLERRITLWMYQRPGGGGALARDYGEFGGAFWCVLTSPDRRERGLVRMKLPHDEARKIAEKLNADDILAIKPGSRVRVQVDVQGTAAERQQVVNTLTEHLRKLQMTVAEQSPLVLQASTEQGNGYQISYRLVGADRAAGNVQTATAAEQISRLKLKEGEKVVWEANQSRGGTPTTLPMKPGQSVQEALEPYQKPDLSFFSRVQIPSFVARQPADGFFGASQISSQGFINMPLSSSGKPEPASKSN